jgi:polyvinyl alcohol dehydrogenase (cytochrome)
MLFTNRLHHRTRHSNGSAQRPPRPRLLLELLEGRNLLDTGLTNVLVNNPALDTTAQDTQSETAIVLGSGSKVIVAYNDTVASYAGDSYHGIGYSRSVNGGASFGEGSLPLSTHHDESDPTLARSAKTGTIFLSTLSVDQVTNNPNPPPPLQWNGLEQVNVYRSTNNGASFQQPANGTPGFVANVDYMDKPWIAVDNFPGPGYGTVYLVTDHAQQLVSGGPVTFDMLLTRSTDDGLTWGPSGGTKIVSSTDANFVGPNVTVGPDHAVYVSWWQYTDKNFPFSHASILMRKSTDGGVTFDDPVTVTKLKTPYFTGDLLLTDGSGHYFNTNAFPQTVINPATGDIYMAFNDQGNGSGNDRGNIYFTQSSNGGRNWSNPVQVNDDRTNNDQWFPALAVTPDGSHVGLFWYDRRLDPANNLIDRFGAIGTVSGHAVTFGANFRITDVSFAPAFTYWDSGVSDWHIQDPVVHPGYMGDYDQAVADNNYFYTTWGDNRLADAFHASQPDVRFVRIPVGWAGSDSSLTALAGLVGAETGAAPSSLRATAPAAPSLAPWAVDQFFAWAGTPDSAWAMYNHDPLGTRNNTAEHKLGPANVGKLGIVWNYPTAAPVAGTPVVVEGVVYAGDEAGNFYAVHADDGRLLWQRHVVAPVTDSALVTHDTVVFGDIGGFIYGLDTESGATRWQIRPSPSIQQSAIWGSATQVGKYVAIGLSSNEDYNTATTQYTENGSVILLDPTDGRVVWQTYMIPDSAYAAGWRGAPVWSTPTYDRQSGLIYVSTGNYYQAGSGTEPGVCDAVIALDARTGVVRWKTQVDKGDIWNRRDFDDGSPAHPDADFGDSPKIYHLADNTEVVGAGSKNGSYYVMNAATGALLNGADGLQLESVYGLLGGLFANGAVDDRAGLVFANGLNWPNLFGSGTGDLYAISADGKRVLWDFKTAPPNGPNGSGVAIANGVVYIQSLDGNLYALDEHATSADTALLARIQTGGTWSGPAISHGRVYEGAGDALRYFFVDPNLFSSGGILCLGLPSEDVLEDVADLSVALTRANLNFAAGPQPGEQVNREANRLAKASPLAAGLFTGGPAVGVGNAGLAGDLLAAALALRSPAPTVIPAGAAMTQATALAPPSLPAGTDQVVTSPTRVSGTPTSSLARRAAHAPAGNWGTDVLTRADLSSEMEVASWAAD